MPLDDILLAVIFLGFGLSILAVGTECFSWRSDRVASLKAGAALRTLYQRTFQRAKTSSMSRPRR